MRQRLWVLHVYSMIHRIPVKILPGFTENEVCTCLNRTDHFKRTTSFNQTFRHTLVYPLCSSCVLFARLGLGLSVISSYSIWGGKLEYSFLNHFVFFPKRKGNLFTNQMLSAYKKPNKLNCGRHSLICHSNLSGQCIYSLPLVFLRPCGPEGRRKWELIISLVFLQELA